MLKEHFLLSVLKTIVPFNIFVEIICFSKLSLKYQYISLSSKPMAPRESLLSLKTTNSCLSNVCPQFLFKRQNTHIHKRISLPLNPTPNKPNGDVRSRGISFKAESHRGVQCVSLGPAMIAMASGAYDVFV